MEHLGYTMDIQWADEDNIYIVSVPDLPGCMTHGKTYEEALQQGKDAIESWLEADFTPQKKSIIEEALYTEGVFSAAFDRALENSRFKQVN